MTIQIELQPNIGQHLSKLYFTDENDDKYLSAGEVVIEPVISPLPISTTPPNIESSTEQTSGSQSVIIALRMRALSYKTERYNWSM